MTDRQRNKKIEQTDKKGEREGMLGEQFLYAGCACEREKERERGGNERWMRVREGLGLEKGRERGRRDIKAEVGREKGTGGRGRA
jgi:hypothetical protein